MYLRAIEGLSAVSLVLPDTGLAALSEEYTDFSRKDTEDAVEVRMKVGEVLVRVTRMLGKPVFFKYMHVVFVALFGRALNYALCGIYVRTSVVALFTHAPLTRIRINVRTRLNRLPLTLHCLPTVTKFLVFKIHPIAILRGMRNILKINCDGLPRFDYFLMAFGTVIRLLPELRGGC